MKRCFRVTLISGQPLPLCQGGAWKLRPPGVPPTVGTRSVRAETEASFATGFGTRVALYSGQVLSLCQRGAGRSQSPGGPPTGEHLQPRGSGKSRVLGRPPNVGTHSEQAETEACAEGPLLTED
uniref:Uncharacterized protein n=1 Tax=Varanus komodoensis TaxID=61221 RepID=A0A8D2L4T9_VARKO